MKKLPHTPRSRVKAALHRLWLTSREKQAATKRDKNTCQVCRVKGSVAKGREVKTCTHHLDGVEWKELVDLVYKRLLVDPSRLQTLCVDCHAKIHAPKAPARRKWPIKA